MTAKVIPWAWPKGRDRKGLATGEVCRYYALPGCIAPEPEKMRIYEEVHETVSYRLDNADRLLKEFRELGCSSNWFEEQRLSMQPEIVEFEWDWANPHESCGYRYILVLPDRFKEIEVLQERVAELRFKLEDAVKWAGYMVPFRERIDELKALNPQPRKLFRLGNKSALHSFDAVIAYAANPGAEIARLDDIYSRMKDAIEHGNMELVKHLNQQVGNFNDLHESVQKLIDRRMLLEVIEREFVFA